VIIIGLFVLMVTPSCPIQALGHPVHKSASGELPKPAAHSVIDEMAGGNGTIVEHRLDSTTRKNDAADHFSTLSNCAAAASTNALNNGCGRLGRLLNSGWNCEPTMKG
jgi:hypothetical protein